MRSFKLICLTLGLAISSCSNGLQSAEAPADLVLLNGVFHTVDDETPKAEVVAIADGKFVYVGDADGVSDYIGETTVQADLGGSFVVPAWIDGHTHPAATGLLTYDAYLPGGSHEDTLAALRIIAEEQPGEGWLSICCYPFPNYVGEGKLGPNKADLDKIFPDRPVWIRSSSAHATWMNSKGLEVIRVDRDTPDPAPMVAYYGRDDSGDLTGWIVEGAGWQFGPGQFPTVQEKVRAGIDYGLQKLVEFGITTVYDAGAFGYEDEVYSYLAELDRADRLPVRYDGSYMVYLPERRHGAIAEMQRLQSTYGGDRLKFRTVKLFMDGVTHELASGMIEPLIGYPERKQSTLLSIEELRDWLIELHDARLDLHVHTMGDLAVRRVLDAVEAAQEIVGADFYPRVTVAHLEVIHIEDWPRFAELGVSANFTPHWHGNMLSQEPANLLGPARAGHVHPSNALMRAGANVTFSSDSFAPDKYNPMMGIQVAHNRRMLEYRLPEGTPDDAFRPPESEKMAIDDMILGYTKNGAYPFRMENDIGTIEVGKLADLVVLSANPFEVDRRSITDIVPTLVLMEGELTLGEFEPL